MTESNQTALQSLSVPEDNGTENVLYTFILSMFICGSRYYKPQKRKQPSLLQYS